MMGRGSSMPSITDLSLRYAAKADALSTLARGIAPRVRHLALRYQGPYDQNVFQQDLRALWVARFEALETLSLERFRVTGAVARSFTPKLVELQMDDCVVEEDAKLWLRRRGLLDARRAGEL